MKLKIKQKITIMTIVFFLNAIVISGIIGCTIINSTSNKRVNALIEASVSDVASKIDSWVSDNTSRMQDLATIINLHKYHTDNRFLAEDFLADFAATVPEFYALYIGTPDNWCVFSDRWEVPDDYIITERQWYQDAIKSDTAVLTDPYIDASTGRMVITVAQRILTDGEVTGVVAADVFLDDVSNIISSMELDVEGYPSLVTKSGMIITHRNKEYTPSLVGENEVYHNFNEFYNGTEFQDYDGVKRVMFSHTIPTCDWTVHYLMDNSELYKDSISIINVYLAVFPALIVLLSVGTYLIVKKIFEPIVTICTDTARMTEGDLSVKFNYDVDDEIGKICRVIEQTNNTLHSYVEDISKHLAEMSDGNFNASLDMQYAGDFAPIGASLHSIQKSLTSVFKDISTASETLLSSAANVSNSASDLAESASNQTALIDEIAGIVSETTDLTKENIIKTEEAKDAANNAANAADDSNAKMQELLVAMDNIVTTSEQIQQMNKAIADIAFQTNILSLNASIEAARAGEAGKGFAVVAGEVGNLANKSAEASKRTTELIAANTDAIKRGKELADTAAESLNAILEQAKQVDTVITVIAESSAKQNTNMTNINNKTESITAHVTASAANAEESAASAVELNEQAHNLENLMSQFNV